jgi:tRNA(fMet)-specific endonuclease VapC
MLDTDTVSYALRGQGQVGPRLLEQKPADVCISAVTAAELAFGAALKGTAKVKSLVDQFCAQVTVVPFDLEAAHRYGTVAAVLRKAGTPIGNIDTLLAAHALAAGCTLVTNNGRHFARIKELRTENWA